MSLNTINAPFAVGLPAGCFLDPMAVHSYPMAVHSYPATRKKWGPPHYHRLTLGNPGSRTNPAYLVARLLFRSSTRFTRYSYGYCPGPGTALAAFWNRPEVDRKL